MGKDYHKREAVEKHDYADMVMCTIINYHQNTTERALFYSGKTLHITYARKVWSHSFTYSFRSLLDKKKKIYSLFTRSGVTNVSLNVLRTKLSRLT